MDRREVQPGPGRAGRLLQGLKTEWRELGRFGRIAMGGIALAALFTVAMGFSITAASQRHLLDAQAEIFSNVIDDLAARGLVPIEGADRATFEAFDEEVRLRLLGGETIRVKVWAPDGTIVYSDADELIGRNFALSAPAMAALEGEPSYLVSDLSEPAHFLERGLGELIEFYLPVLGEDGVPFGLFEVEQRVDAFHSHLGRIRWNVWLSIGAGLGILSIFMASFTLANTRVLARRRRQAEQLLGDLLAAQEEERARIVGSLHDDIGQPLYRLLYGLEGSRSHLDTGHPLAGEMERLEGIVRDLDEKLRAELRLLHHTMAEDVGVRVALTQLAETTEAETELHVFLDVDADEPTEPVLRTALYRAAQEALTNVRKHAGATRVHLRLVGDGRRVVLEVEDDGRGVDDPEGIGLATTRERLEAIGGGLRVESRRKGGTLVRAWVPARSAELQVEGR